MMTKQELRDLQVLSDVLAKDVPVNAKVESVIPYFEDAVRQGLADMLGMTPVELDIWLNDL